MIMLSWNLSECLPGYYGDQCNKTCRHPNYGHNCQLNCMCEEDQCDPITGCDSKSKIWLYFNF